ncbi:MAG TPA: hypothetical protein VMU54_13980, partial [Planctomycetota bacterium]|nr:hypothetical protein [Planctomycetota bacterium]
MNEAANPELEGLIHGYLDETLADPEAQRLRDLLLTDPRNLDQFVRGVDLHGVLAGLRSEAEPGTSPGEAIRAEGGPPLPGPAESIESFKERLRRRAEASTDPQVPGPRSAGAKRLLKLVSGLAAAVGFIVLGNAFSLEGPPLTNPELALGDPASIDRVSDGVELQAKSSLESSGEALRRASSAGRPENGRWQNQVRLPSQKALQESSVGRVWDEAEKQDKAVGASGKDASLDDRSRTGLPQEPMSQTPAALKVPSVTE